MIDPQIIIEEVFRYYNFDLILLQERMRYREITIARHMCFKFLREFTSLPLKKIGKFFERDHSSVISALETLDWGIKTDKVLLQQYNFLNTRLQSLS